MRLERDHPLNELVCTIGGITLTDLDIGHFQYVQDIVRLLSKEFYDTTSQMTDRPARFQHHV